MKFIYVSNEVDEKSIPDSANLVFRGHTYSIEVEKDSYSYNFSGYMPEHRLGPWLDSPEGSVALVSKDIGIEPKYYFVEKNVYGRDFELTEYFGSKSVNREGRKFGDLCVINEESSVAGGYILRAYRNLNSPWLFEINEGLANAYIVVEDNLVILTNGPRAILSVDSSFVINWKKGFQNANPRHADIAFFQYKSSAIASLGSTHRDAGDGQIISVDTRNGDTLWLRDIPFVVDYCTLVGDRIYLSGRDDWQWYILSADTGEILLEDSINFEDEDADLGRLWSHDGFLFLYLRYNVLRIMDETTGRVLQDIPIPEEFILSLGFYPEVIGDYIYIRLSNGGGIERMSTYGGVMILPREELKQGFPLTIEVEDKGDISHQAIEDGKTEYYEITASYEELGDVLRFGQIEIKLVAQRFAYNHWGNLDDNWKTRINKKFDGRMVFNVDKAKLKNPDDSRFDLMVELFNKHFAEKFRAPANKKPLTIEWRYI